MNDQTLHLSNEQVELLSAIGAYLRDLRLHQKLSLEDVATSTHIPLRILTAIEEGNRNQLPEPVYVQGFIRRYADAIGVDGHEFANAFPTDVRDRSAKPSWKGSIEAQLRPIHLYALYTLLVVGAVSGLSYMLNRSSDSASRYAKPPQQTGQPLAQTSGEFYGPPAPGTVSKSPIKTASVAPSSSNPSSSNPSSNKAVRVNLEVKGQQSWLRIVVDGKTDFEGVLPQGTQRSWVADKQLTVRAGDAGAVVISHNDGQPELMGKPGDVEEKTFESSSSHANSTSITNQTLATTGRQVF